MPSYKDKTFCGFYESCKDGKTCPRKLDDDVIVGSALTGFPIAHFTSEPECYVVDIRNGKNYSVKIKGQP